MVIVAEATGHKLCQVGQEVRTLATANAACGREIHIPLLKMKISL